MYICVECDRVFTKETKPSDKFMYLDSICPACGGELEEHLPGDIPQNEIDEMVNQQTDIL